MAGIALTALYAENGWIGRWLPVKVSFTPLRAWLAPVFIDLPFSVSPGFALFARPASATGRQHPICRPSSLPKQLAVWQCFLFIFHSSSSLLYISSNS